MTIYAQWSANTNNPVSFDNQGATTAQSSDGSTTYTTGSAIASIPTTDPLKSGYTFSGWFSASTAGSAVTNGSYTPSSPYGAVTIYAQWSANPTHLISYNLNGGRFEDRKPTPTQRPVAEGLSFKVASGKELKKTGYTFGGWSDGSKTYTSGSSYLMGTSNVVLTAVWIPKQYKISWNIRTNGGTSGGTFGAITYNVGSPIGVLPTDAVRQGKIFKGWFTSSKGGTKITSNYLVTTPFGDITFYAQFG